MHETIEVESWYHITARITGIRIPYGDKHLTIFSIYAPAQQGRNNSQRTNQFYETLADKTREAKGRGELVILGGDWNASIQQLSLIHISEPTRQAEKPYADAC